MNSQRIQRLHELLPTTIQWPRSHKGLGFLMFDYQTQSNTTALTTVHLLHYNSKGRSTPRLMRVNAAFHLSFVDTLYDGKKWRGGSSQDISEASGQILRLVGYVPNIMFVKNDLDHS